jgi:hypothetical protein
LTPKALDILTKVFNVGEVFPSSIELKLDAAIPVISDRAVRDISFCLR